jgi:phosphoribosylamine--glycine ligase
MNILLVGSGGREHALAWKIKQSPRVTRLVCAPGNPGMAAIAEVRDLKATDVARLVMLAQEIAADLVVIGPEVAVEAGLADALEAANIPCFGPTAAAGRLDSYMDVANAWCDRHPLATTA